MGRGKGKQARVDWLDALRGWAIVGVILVHTGQDVRGLPSILRGATDAGQYGVQLFFVVSALTIFLTYGRQIEANGNTMRSNAAWLVKRGFRIAPLYYYGVALYLVVFTAMQLSGSLLPVNSAADIVANLLFVHAWIPSAQNSVVPGGWSIGVEMCFYLAVPFIFWATRTIWGSIVALAISVAVALAADRILAPMAGDGPTIVNNSFLYFWFPTQLPVFLAGAALFRIAGPKLWNDEPSNSSGILWACCGLAATTVGLALGTVGHIDDGLAPTAMGIAFCLFAFLCRLPSLGLLLVNRITRDLGRISYSVYINHFVFVLLLRFAIKHTGLWDRIPAPVGLLLGFGIVLGGAVLVSEITRRLIEKPGIDFGHQLAKSIEGPRDRSHGIHIPTS